MKTNRLTPYFFLAPFMAAFSLFFILPVLYSVYLSFLTRVRNGFAPPVEVFGGFVNYARVFADSDFIASFVNILIFGVIQVPLMLLFATIFALIIDEAKGWLSRVFRTAIYIPYTIPGVIAGLLWGFLYSRNLSPLNFALTSSGNEPVNFLSSSLLLFSIGNIVTWTWTGYNSTKQRQ
jgi:multiple sugar transport system permease protein